MVLVLLFLGQKCSEHCVLLLWVVLNSFLLFFFSDLNVEKEKQSVLFPSLNVCMN